MLEPFAIHDITPSDYMGPCICETSYRTMTSFLPPWKQSPFVAVEKMACLKGLCLFELESLKKMFCCVGSSSGAADTLECASLWGFNAYFPFNYYAKYILPPTCLPTQRKLATK